MKNIYLMGDIHGYYELIEDFEKRIKNQLSDNREDNILILLGDAGLNYYLGYGDKKPKRKLNNYPFTYFIIRGNHEQRPSILAEENPSDWEIQTFFGNKVYVELKYPNIKYAMDDVQLYNIGGYDSLIIPGAYSVDKYWRLQNGYSWFPQEQLSTEEMKKGLELINNLEAIELILSHTCPISFEPTDLFLPQIDQSMVDKTMERYLGKIDYELPYKVWAWGHYHQHREYSRDSVCPSLTDPRCIMLFDSAVELNELMNSKDLVTKL